MFLDKLSNSLFVVIFPPQRQQTEKHECTLTPSVVWKRDGEMICLTHGIRWKECTTAGQHVKEEREKKRREREEEGVKEAETADGGWVAYLCHFFHILVLWPIQPPVQISPTLCSVCFSLQGRSVKSPLRGRAVPTCPAEVLQAGIPLAFTSLFHIQPAGCEFCTLQMIGFEF